MSTAPRPHHFCVRGRRRLGRGSSAGHAPLTRESSATRGRSAPRSREDRRLRVAPVSTHRGSRGRPPVDNRDQFGRPCAVTWAPLDNRSITAQWRSPPVRRPGRARASASSVVARCSRKPTLWVHCQTCRSGGRLVSRFTSATRILRISSPGRAKPEMRNTKMRRNLTGHDSASSYAMTKTTLPLLHVFRYSGSNWSDSMPAWGAVVTGF